MVYPAFSGILENLRDLFPVKWIKRLQIARHLLEIRTPWCFFTLRSGLGKFIYHQFYNLLPFNNIPGSQEVFITYILLNFRRRY